MQVWQVLISPIWERNFGKLPYDFRDMTEPLWQGGFVVIEIASVI